jgi:mono/diheme cytochrome c family protein
MKIHTGFIFTLSMFFLTCGPVFLAAQSNHCAVKKSPFRISMDSGKVVYAGLCQVCHQMDGLGISSLNPPLTGKQVIGEKTKLITIVIRGLATHQEIEGQSYPNVMPGNPDMNDAEIADVLTYIRNSFGNKASSVKVSEVKSARSRLN